MANNFAYIVARGAPNNGHRITCTENFVKFEDAVSEKNELVDRQTYIPTHFAPLSHT